MVFSSHIFVFYFLPLVLCMYYVTPFRPRTAVIAVASYVFYGWANPILAAIMRFSSSVDYVGLEAFFPDLVAGPIIRYAAMEGQMRVRKHTLDKFARGAAFFSFGMAKKILVANAMAHIADAAFGAGPLRVQDAWFGVFGY